MDKLKSNNNLVSVIVPAYNRAERITNAMDSVWAQTYRPIELLIVDDGSIDNTREVVKSWIKEQEKQDIFNAKYIHQENSGAPEARNTGIKNAKGRYLQFLDSDDLIHKEKLQEQIKLLKGEKTAICLSDYSAIDDEGNILYNVSNNISIQKAIKLFVGVHTSVPLIDKYFFSDEQLTWNTKLKKLQDIDYFIKLFMLSAKVSYVNKSLFFWVIHEDDRITTSNAKDGSVHRPILRSILKFHIRNLSNIKFNYYKSLPFLYCKLCWRSTGLSPLPNFINKRRRTLNRKNFKKDNLTE